MCTEFKKSKETHGEDALLSNFTCAHMIPSSTSIVQTWQQSAPKNNVCKTADHITSKTAYNIIVDSHNSWIDVDIYCVLSEPPVCDALPIS